MLQPPNVHLVSVHQATLMVIRPQRSIETIASFDQWSINHQKLLKAMVATSKTHRKTIDGNGQTAQKTFNGDGLLKNHWKFAMFSSKPLKFTMVS